MPRNGRARGACGLRTWQLHKRLQHATLTNPHDSSAAKDNWLWNNVASRPEEARRGLATALPHRIAAYPPVYLPNPAWCGYTPAMNMLVPEPWRIYAAGGVAIAISLILFVVICLL